MVSRGARGANGAAAGGSGRGVVARCCREEDQDAVSASASCRRKQLLHPWHHIISIERLGRCGPIFRGSSAATVCICTVITWPVATWKQVQLDGRYPMLLADAQSTPAPGLYSTGTGRVSSQCKNDASSHHPSSSLASN